MQKVEHIGIAVRKLSVSIPLFENLLNTICYKTETVESENVNTAFFQKSETKIELLESSTSDGVIAKFIEKRGEGIHHIAFKSDEINNELSRLNNAGIQLINSEPREGAHEMLIAFLHPKSTGGVLMEICEPKHDH